MVVSKYYTIIRILGIINPRQYVPGFNTSLVTRPTRKHKLLHKLTTHRSECMHCMFMYVPRLVPNLLLGAWLTHSGAMAEVAILFEVLLGKRSRSCTRVMCECVCRSPACRLQITSLVTFLLYFQDCTAKNRCVVAIL